MRFSQRIGKTPVRQHLQVNSIDDDLRRGLWNAYRFAWPITTTHFVVTSYYQRFYQALWHRFFKWPIDTINTLIETNEAAIREWFFHSQWYEAYDFIEFLLSIDETDRIANLRRCANEVLERELSGYRIVGNQVVKITDANELAALQEALSRPDDAFAPARNHLCAATDFLFRRENPDYRNSIKESISAVEAIAALITKKPKPNLADALVQLQKGGLHPALHKAFLAMYGYASDAGGILICSPESSPGGMRVFEAWKAKEILDERQKAHPGADHRQAA